MFGSASADLMMSRAHSLRQLINRTDTRMQPNPAARYLRSRRAYLTEESIPATQRVVSRFGAVLRVLCASVTPTDGQDRRSSYISCASRLSVANSAT